MQAVRWCGRWGGAGGRVVRAVGWCGRWGGADGGVVRSVGLCGRWDGACGGVVRRWVVRVVMCWWVHDTFMLSHDLTFVILELEL